MKADGWDDLQALIEAYNAKQGVDDGNFVRCVLRMLLHLTEENERMKEAFRKIGGER